jgi:Tol biopolymer transport system component
MTRYRMCLVLLPALVVLGACLVGCGGGGGNAAPDEFVLISSNRSGNFEILRANVTKHTFVNLSNDAADDTSPSYNALGTKIVFVSNRDGNEEIYLMNADGTAQQRLTTNLTQDRHPRFSPDGTKVIFDRGGDNDAQIFTYDISSTQETALTATGAANYAPCYNPGGDEIVFVSERDSNPEIYVMTAAGQNPTRLTNTPLVNETSPVYNPAGTMIAYVAEPSGAANQAEVYQMDVNGNNSVNLTNSSGNDIDPAYSLNGLKLMFASVRNGRYEIFEAPLSNPTLQSRIVASLGTDDNKHPVPRP